MNELFLRVINVSISAGWLVLAVLVLRLVLKKGPKWVSVLLWGIVAARLLLPFSIKSHLSLIPSAETIPGKVLSGPSFDIQTGISPVDDRVNDYLGGRYFEGVTVPVNNGLNVVTVLTVVWLVGVLLMLAYTAFSYWRLRRSISTAVVLRDNIYQSEKVTSPFVLGIFWPEIYLPFDLDGKDLEHVLAHERAHIRRKDHWWKLLGFFLLTVHWFNPLMWLAYVLLCRDIELACDEKVIKGLCSEQRANYTQALLTFSVTRRAVTACPLAFGEVGVKARVKSVLNYKKPGFWVILTAVVLCIVTVVCFLTDPIRTPAVVLSDLSASEVRYADISFWKHDQIHQLQVQLDEAQINEVVDILNRIDGNDFEKEEVSHDISLYFYCGDYNGYDKEVGIHYKNGYFEFFFDSGTAEALDMEYDAIQNDELEAFVAGLSLAHLGVDLTASGDFEDGSKGEDRSYYLTVGADGMNPILVSVPGMSCRYTSAYKKGDVIRLEFLDGRPDLRGLSITAYSVDGKNDWTTHIPDTEENQGFTHLTQDGWTITDLPPG